MAVLLMLALRLVVRARLLRVLKGIADTVVPISGCELGDAQRVTHGLVVDLPRQSC